MTGRARGVSRERCDRKRNARAVDRFRRSAASNATSRSPRNEARGDADEARGVTVGESAMDKLMEAMRRDGAIDAIGRPTKVVSCIRAGVSDARGVGMGWDRRRRRRRRTLADFAQAWTRASRRVEGKASAAVLQHLDASTSAEKRSSTSRRAVASVRCSTVWFCVAPPPSRETFRWRRRAASALIWFLRCACRTLEVLRRLRRQKDHRLR